MMKYLKKFFESRFTYKFTSEDFEDILIDFIDLKYEVKVELGFIDNRYSFTKDPSVDSKNLGYKISVKESSDSEDIDIDEDQITGDSIDEFNDKSIKAYEIRKQISSCLKRIESNVGPVRIDFYNIFNFKIYVIEKDTQDLKVDRYESLFHQISNKLFKSTNLYAREFKVTKNPDKFEINIQIDESVSRSRFDRFVGKIRKGIWFEDINTRYFYPKKVNTSFKDKRVLISLENIKDLI